jgi:ubiquinone/menaquinone biosynthesis C-methylase UbiE
MRLRTGIPLLTELDAHLKSDEYRRHVEFNRQFLQANDDAMEQYGKLWAKDTFRLWSRRWEYPFVAQRVMEKAAQNPAEPLRVLDAGSGVTYFPYFLCENLPRVEVVCYDSNPSYHPMFAAINAANPSAKVRFVEGMLQKMPFEPASIDAVCCISVLEHTENYSAILDEFHRVLKPGGVLVLTFDLSLDSKFELPKDQAKALLKEIAQKFEVRDGANHVEELSRMDEPKSSGILTTDHIRETEPDLLPWKYPMLKAAHDLVKGHGWTGGFRSKSIYCLDVRKK